MFYILFALFAGTVALVPISQSDSIVVDNTGAHRNVHTGTFVCDPDHVGTSSFNVTDPQSQEIYEVTIVCAPPKTNFDAVLAGFVSRDAFVYDREVCYVAIQADTSGTAESKRGKRSVRTQNVLSNLQGGWSCVGALVGATSCGGASGTRNALNKLGAVVVDLKNETETIYRIEQNTKAALDAQIRIDGSYSADIDLLAKQNAAEENSITTLNSMIKETIDLTESFGTKFAKSIGTLAGEIAALTNETDQLELAMSSFSSSTKDNFVRVASQIQNVAGLQQRSELLAYQQYMKTRERRVLTSLYTAAQTDTDNDPNLAISTPMTSPEYQTPVEGFVSSAANSFVMGSVSTQGTILQGGIRYFRQRDYEYRCDPLYVLDMAPPTVQLQDLIYMMGKGEGSNASTLVSCLGSDTEDTWTCQCVVTVTDTACRLANSSEIMPFDLPAFKTIDLRIDNANRTAICQGGTLDTTPGYSTGIQAGSSMGPPNVYTSSIGLADLMKTDCATPHAHGGTGVWLAREQDGRNLTLRVQRSDYNRFVDMAIPVGITADSDYCISLPSEFSHTGDNDLKPAWVMWYRMAQSYEMTFTSQRFNDLEITHFGVLPAGLTYYEDNFSPARGSNRSQQCTGVSFVRLRNTGVVDADVLGLYKLTPTQQTTSQMTFSIRKVGNGTTTGTLAFDPNSTTPGSVSHTFDDAAGPIIGSVSNVIIESSTSTLPWNKLVLETPRWWSSHGRVFDAPYSTLSLSGTAASRKGTPTYIHHPADAGPDPTAYNKTNIFTSLTDLRYWSDKESSRFDAHSVGDSAQEYARGYSSDHVCSDFKFRNDSSAGSGGFTGDNDLCAFLYNYRVDPLGPTGLSFKAVPRSGWATILTLRLPTGTITTGFASVCPTYGTNVTEGEDMELTLGNPLSTPITVCLVTRGGSSATNLDPDCTLPPVPVTISNVEHTETYQYQDGCPARYVQVYTVSSEGDCTDPPPVSAVACFPDQGVAIHAPVPSGNLPDNANSNSATTSYTDKLADSHLALARQAADLQVAIADFTAQARRGELSEAEVLSGIQTVLENQLAANQAFATTVTSPSYVNNQIAQFNATIAAQAASIAANINEAAADGRQVQANLNLTNELIANMTAIQAQTAQDLEVLHNLTLKTANDTLAALKAIREVHDEDELGNPFGGVGKAFKSALTSVTKAAGGMFKAPFELGRGLMGFIHMILGIVVMAGVVFGLGYLCYMIYGCVQSRREAQKTKALYSRIEQRDTPMTQRGSTPGGLAL